MIRTASTPSGSVAPDLNTVSSNPEPVVVPGILPRNPISRSKPKKHPSPPSPGQLQVPNSNPRQRRGNNPPRQRRRAHSRVSDSGWLTDEIVGGQSRLYDVLKRERIAAAEIEYGIGTDLGRK